MRYKNTVVDQWNTKLTTYNDVRRDQILNAHLCAQVIAAWIFITMRNNIQLLRLSGVSTNLGNHQSLELVAFFHIYKLSDVQISAVKQ